MTGLGMMELLYKGLGKKEPDMTEPDMTGPDMTETGMMEPGMTGPDMRELGMMETGMKGPGMMELPQKELMPYLEMVTQQCLLLFQVRQIWMLLYRFLYLRI